MQHKRKTAIMITGVCLLGLVLACQFPRCTPQEDEMTLETELAMTLESIKKEQADLAQAITQKPPAIQPQAAAQDVSDTSQTCNVPKFQSETIPDGTTFKPGESFTKTWTVRNDGDCTWTNAYKFVFVSGNRMEGAASQNLTSSVAPGSNVTFSVNLTAPSSDGSYTGTWKIQAPDDQQFGNYWASIKVGSSPAAPQTDQQAAPIEEPLLFTFYPESGAHGTEVSINLNRPADVTVYYDGKVMPKKVTNDGYTFVVTIPVGARTAYFELKGDGINLKASKPFTVSLSFYFSPESGPAGSEVSLFLNQPADVSVYYDGKVMPKKTLTDGTTLIVTIPAGAQNAYFELKGDGIYLKSQKPFVVTP